MRVLIPGFGKRAKTTHPKSKEKNTNSALIASARESVAVKLNAEITRLTALGELNDHIQAAELDALRAHQAALTAAITGAQIRLDAVRLVRKR